MEHVKLEKRIAKTIRENNLIENGDKIVLGVSGGPDSICMLDVLNKIQKCYIDLEDLSGYGRNSCKEKAEPVVRNFEIVVAHVNHMIREEADEDEKFVEDFCRKREITFFSKKVNVSQIAQNHKIGTEEAGRLARYEFFEEILHKVGANKIAIAHNKNDKVETILMNMLRGSGISGLKGIDVKRGKIIRPLMECERQEIEAYCEENNLQPRIDKTNFENFYTRNKIRNVVIPYIKQEFNPNIVDTINRLSELVKEEEKYMERQVKAIYEKIVVEEKYYSKEALLETQHYQENSCQENVEPMAQEIVLDLKQFNSQEKVIKAKMILFIVTKLFGTSQGIEKVHIEDVIKLCHNNIGNKYLTPNKHLKISIQKHQIFFKKI